MEPDALQRENKPLERRVILTGVLRRDYAGILLAGLAMSVGWGFRGDYGHEAGAMVPGALLGMAMCLGSGREDWWKRSAIVGLFGAIGWAFGGQMSYGRIIGYTASSSLPNVAYGYACLFIIGGLWAGIGSGVLAMSLTRPFSSLNAFTAPLTGLMVVWMGLDVTGLSERLVEKWPMHDTDWVAATSAVVVAIVCARIFPSSRPACMLIGRLGLSWWLGYLLLTVVLNLHMTPPRSDNWSGCVGLFIGLLTYLMRQRESAACVMMSWGFLFGGIGFVAGDFVNMLGRGQWGPIGAYASLQGLDYWKWMEQLFGLIMGLGIGWVFLRRLQNRAVVQEERPSRWLQMGAVIFLLILMFWANFHKTVRNWRLAEAIPETILGVGVGHVILLIALLLSFAVIAGLNGLRRQEQTLPPASPLRRNQGLFLIILWVAVVGALLQAFPRMSSPAVFLVHVTFWITASICSLIVACLPAVSTRGRSGRTPPWAGSWTLGRHFWSCCLLTLVFVLALAQLTVLSHEGDLPGSHRRFGISDESISPSGN